MLILFFCPMHVNNVIDNPLGIPVAIPIVMKSAKVKGTEGNSKLS